MSVETAPRWLFFAVGHAEGGEAVKTRRKVGLALVGASRGGESEYGTSGVGREGKEQAKGSKKRGGERTPKSPRPPWKPEQGPGGTC
jgi:hypothetical protein